MSTKRIDGSTYTSDGLVGTWNTDLLTDQWDKLSIQLNYANAEGQTNFADGVKASGTITIDDYTTLAGATVSVNGTDLVEGVDWTAAVSNDATATSLELAVEAVTNINSSAAANVITVVYATVGVIGNAVTLTTDADDITLSGATLENGADSDINDADDEITIVDHGYETGDKVNFDKITGTVPTGLSDNTDYYVITVDADTIQLADSYAHAIAETALNIAGAAAGGGTFTLTPTAIGGTVTLYASNDGENWVAMTSPTPLTISANGSTLWESVDVTARYVRVSWVVADGSSIDASFKLNAKGEAN